MAILSKYKRLNPNAVLLTDNIFDFVLSKDSTKGTTVDGKLTVDNLISYIDFSNEECNSKSDYVSSLQEYVWEESLNNGVELNSIGFTGIDNGFIDFNRQTITNEDYVKLLTESKYTINCGDNKLKLKSVVSNSGKYSYEIVDKDGYSSLKGGFYQGFFSTDGCSYKVLPTSIKNGLSLEFVVRPRNYEEKKNTLNSSHINNKGILFYIGTRSENKFLNLYPYDFSAYEKSAYSPIEPCDCNSYYACMNNESIDELTTDELREALQSIYNVVNEDKQCCECIDVNYFTDDYIIETQDEYFEEGYLFKDIDLDDVAIKDEGGFDINIEDKIEIETDNKFLIFNNTENGFNSNTWDDNNRLILTGTSTNNDYNLFLLLNQTETGYTANTIKEFYEKLPKKEPNIKKDIVNNAFAIKINDNGSIGYRYIESDCENDNGFKISEEYSRESLIKTDEWNIIHVKILPTSLSKCNSCNGSNKMKIMIYVNGNLKFISRELEMLDLRPLDESSDKQEGVPFTISLGGGTNGLSESIWLDVYKPFEYILPIEQYFSGSFIGDIKSFKIYEGNLELNQIKNNFLHEQSLLE